MIDPAAILEVGSVIFAGGAAWGGAKVALNGTRKRVQELVDARESQQGELKTHGERLASIETKVDILIKREGL